MHNVQQPNAEMDQFFNKAFSLTLDLPTFSKMSKQAEMQYLILTLTCSRQKKPIPLLNLTANNHYIINMPSKFSAI